VAGYLEGEKAISPLIRESRAGRAPHGQAAQNKRSRSEAELLVPDSTPLANQLNVLGLLYSPLRDLEFRETILQN